MPKKSVNSIADDYFKLSPIEQKIAMRYMENKLLGRTKENADIRSMLGMNDKTPKESTE